MADEIEQDRNVVNIELQTVESHAAGTNCIADFVEKSPENIQNVKRLKKLVQLADANVNFQSDKDGTTALHSAVSMGKAEFVDVLLGAGAEIKQDTDGNTALHYAVEHTSEAEAFDKFERLMPRKILANERWDWKFKREQLDAVTLVNNKGFNILNLALELGKMIFFSRAL
ncbi:uncharacterized protein LOC128552949 isoform X2 [Mercenaria mercenaria]|uniref:uncharacterized protein LOC128552949 isoform X2 n=1 Tax=Mercenaria mercenaria TaxID=6596 RepID=UPI00234E9501|nr:uncharacterized protein LOC128552949 isoform X2 [Mercenaria mercenaria]